MLDNTPLESARKYIEEKGNENFVSLLNVEPEPGTEVIAFQVTDFIEAWALKTEELAIDSTCE